MMARLRRRVVGRGLALVIGLIGVLLVSPALGAGQDPPVDQFATWWPACEPMKSPPLPEALRQRVDAAARAYLAPDQATAEEVARRLAFAPQPHPSNMCGPLAVAILRDAGLVEPTKPLAAYWLLDPRLHAHLLYHLFPPEKFCYRHFRLPPSQVDFRSFPLHVGDFLYLYAGRWGTFEHVLVVTRVDAAGRAYAVTNLNLRPEGYYVVREVLLYDPALPGVGVFAQWADPAYAAIGLTGFGGFDLWRPLPGVWAEPVGGSQSQGRGEAPPVEAVFTDGAVPLWDGRPALARNCGLVAWGLPRWLAPCLLPTPR